MNILLVAPHFPPSALPPSIRVRMYCRYFKQFGIHPYVLTVSENQTNEIKDDFMLNGLENFSELSYTKVVDKYKARNLGVGDLGLRMLPFLKKEVVKLHKSITFDAILYIVPPWYILLRANAIKKATNVPYFVDYIDPWVARRKLNDIKAHFLNIVSKLGEGISAKGAKGIISVSQGVFDGLEQRHPNLKDKPQLVLPYGVDLNDIEKIKSPDGKVTNSKCISIRYIGAVSDAMIPVVRVLLHALKRVSNKHQIQLDFIGTSYGDKTSKLEQIINETRVASFVSENPSRVSYKEALTLTKSSNITFVIGDTTKYYAASKLMGLIASQVKFFVFAHEESFPYQLLKDIDYNYVLGYNLNSYLSEDKQEELYQMVLRLIEDVDYQPIDTGEKWFQEHTAKGMVNKMSVFLRDLNEL